MLLVKDWLLPGSLAFLVLGMALGIILLYGPQRARIWGRRWLAGLGAAYWFFSVPMGADVLSRVMAGTARPLATADGARGAAAVVVLDGATERYRSRGLAFDAPNTPTALRALEGIRVYRLLGDPIVVVTSGGTVGCDASSPEGAALRDTMVHGGVPAGRVLLDSGSPNTRAHAVNTARLLQARGIRQIVLVTSPSHIRRATAAFRAVGFDVVPSPARAYSEDLAPGWHWTNWCPSPEALRVSQEDLRDAFALVYYLARGWLSPGLPAP